MNEWFQTDAYIQLVNFIMTEVASRNGAYPDMTSQSDASPCDFGDDPEAIFGTLKCMAMFWLL